MLRASPLEQIGRCFQLRQRDGQRKVTIVSRQLCPSFGNCPAVGRAIASDLRIARMPTSVTEMVPSFMQIDENKRVAIYRRMEGQPAKEVDRSNTITNRCLSVYCCNPVKDPKPQHRKSQPKDLS
jgi:hypothetical protein